jgi:hypothetical protein
MSSARGEFGDVFGFAFTIGVIVIEILPRHKTSEDSGTVSPVVVINVIKISQLTRSMAGA